MGKNESAVGKSEFRDKVIGTSTCSESYKDIGTPIPLTCKGVSEDHADGRDLRGCETRRLSVEKRPLKRSQVRTTKYL